MKSFISFELYVSRVQETAVFFEKHFGAKQEYGSDTFAILWLGKTRVILDQLNLEELTPANPILKEGALEHRGSGIEIVVSVEKLKRVYKSIAAENVSGLTPIDTRPWGLQDFRFLLPDGYYVRVTEAGKDVSKVW